MSEQNAPVEGLVEFRTAKGQAATIAAVLASLKTRKVPLLARIDHAAAAEAAGMSLPPTELLIFGNAKAGTPLMCARRLVALDLPLRLLVQRTSDGQTSLSYNDPLWIGRRHHLSTASDGVLNAMRDLLDAIVRDAIAAMPS